ncbi:portal protein [Stenotrophomonas sp. AB1(2024)]|uniref:portal protein n=1 Tax=Stenotrophomonas sp. AB1(2024) TaxID=3132215 RepID=UPI003095D713
MADDYDAITEEDEESHAPEPGMTDEELAALIDRESAVAIGINDQFASDREEMRYFYMGEARGKLSPPDAEGHSQIVSKTLMDTVEWIMPSLMKMFSQEGVVVFEPESREDEKDTQDASTYCNYLFFKENEEGFTTLHDAIKSCLIFRMGVTKTWCEKAWDERQEIYRSVSSAEIEALSQDEGVEIASIEEVGQLSPEQLPEGAPPEAAILYDVTLKLREQKNKIKVDGVPPEEIRIARDTRTLADVRYIAHVVERTRSDLLSEGWPEDEVDTYCGDQEAGQWEKNERHEYDGSEDYDDNEGDESQRKITVTEAYIKVDFDGDGIAEYRRVVKAGRYIHSNEVTDDHPFSLATPILMPYKLIGLSFYDLVEDLQRIHTVLTRQMMDNAYLVNMPQTTVVNGQVNLDDLLNPRPGGYRRVNSLEALRVDTTPFIGPQVLTLLDHFGQVRDTRTGVTEMNSSLNADSLAKGNIGSEGISELISQGAQRIELVARVIAETFMRRQWRLLLKMAKQYTDREREIKVNGEWLQIDPRQWKNQYRMSVSVGVGNQGEAKKMMGLQLIASTQEKAFELGIVTPENAMNLALDIARAAGEKQPERYFSPAPPPQPDQGPPPEVQIEQMRQQGRLQEIQVKAQTDIQVARMTQEAQAQQAMQETQLEAQRNELDRQAQADQAALKLKYDAQLAQLKLQYEDEDRQRERDFLRWKAELEASVKIETANISSKAKIDNAATDTATAEIAQEVQQ